MRNKITILAVVGLLVGCGGVSRAPITVSLKAQTQAIDQGQKTTITATLTGDTTNKGVSWSLSGVGSHLDQTATSVTYNAPATASSVTKPVITATAVANTNVTAQIIITLNPAPTVTTTSLPAGVVGTAYSFTLQASGGTGAYTWKASSGSLPGWATLVTTSGTISGTPNVTGTSNLSITVTDSTGLASAAQAFSLAVGPPAPLAVSTTTLPGGTMGLAYSAQLAATGGLLPYTWSVSSGALPSWASLASSSGIISGTAAATGTWSFTVRVTDSESPPVSATQALAITVTVSANNKELLGDYAFRLQGFDDATGDQFAAVGGFYADGNGNVTSRRSENRRVGKERAEPITGYE